MKVVAYIFFVTIFSFNIFNITYANENSKIYGLIKKNNLTIISYSKNWNNSSLEALYRELLNNTISNEIQYLSKIIINASGNSNVFAEYNDDISVNKDGTYHLGHNATITINYGNRYKNIKDIAYFLSHEYGHHYTLYNIVKYEQIYPSELLLNTEYGNLRNLRNYPISYNISRNYNYIWDIQEILANDYVQLLGSKTAKQSYKYKDNLQKVQEGLESQEYEPLFYNALPQQNKYLPIATSVNGLLKYFLKIANYNYFADNSIIKLPKIVNIKEIKQSYGKQYILLYDRDINNKNLEYTVIMHPKDSNFTIFPLKTLNYNEEPIVIFGNTQYKDKNGKLYTYSESYEGKYEFIIYSKDSSGLIFASEPFIYDFGK